MCLPSRNGAIDAIKSAAALRLFPCLCVLRFPERSEHLRNHPTARFEKRWLFCKFQLFNRSTCSRQESGGSSACGNEIAAKRWCLAFRRSRAKRTPPARHRTSLNRVNCTNANTYNVRTSGILPPYKSKIPKGGFGALWRVFLLYLSSREERWSPRRA